MYENEMKETEIVRLLALNIDSPEMAGKCFWCGTDYRGIDQDSMATVDDMADFMDGKKIEIDTIKTCHRCGQMSMRTDIA